MKARLAWLAFVVAVVFATVSLFLLFVEHRVVKRVEVPRKRSWMDYTSYAALAILVVLLVRKEHSRYSTTY